MLHIAPEECLEKKFKERLGAGYVSMDKSSKRAMHNMDVTDIKFGTQTFDFLYCSHVLEHVVEDIKAMKEMFRVIKLGGFAIINVPLDVNRRKTFEDINVTDPDERQKKFGQGDHVRIYGKDYVERLRKAGFDVCVLSPEDIADKKERVRMGITKLSGEIYLCRKPK
jgi:predicted SAM-dependent methyltransferase